MGIPLQRAFCNACHSDEGQCPQSNVRQVDHHIVRMMVQEYRPCERGDNSCKGEFVNAGRSVRTTLHSVLKTHIQPCITPANAVAALLTTGLCLWLGRIGQTDIVVRLIVPRRVSNTTAAGRGQAGSKELSFLSLDGLPYAIRLAPH